MQKLELAEDLTLPTPIVVNGVSISNSQRMNYVSFQLNTLGMQDNDGLKNVCFYDTDNELYHNRPTVD